MIMSTMVLSASTARVLKINDPFSEVINNICGILRDLSILWEGKISDSIVEKDTICSICLETCEKNKRACKLKCNHVFHRECIKKWDGGSCPNCRKKYSLE